MAWLSGWSYRKEITITGQSGAGTNYQVYLDIGDSAGGDFHLEGNCTNFPQDIEVTDNDGTTLLKFKIEDLTADPLKMWVKVADDLGSNQTIYIYYGKSGATTNSDGAATFIQYHGAASGDFWESTGRRDDSIIYESEITIANTSHDITFGLSSTATYNGDDAIYIDSYRGTNLVYIVSRNTGSTTVDSEAPDIGDATAHKTKIVYVDSASVDGYIDGNPIGSQITTNLPDAALGLFIDLLSGTISQTWAFMREYASPEPAFSSAGSEETPPVTGNPYWYYQMLRRRN